MDVLINRKGVKELTTSITLKCYDQTLKPDNSPKIASGGMNENIVKFRFCNLWKDFVKTAVFYRTEKNVYHALLDENNSCVIPHEVTDDPGVFYIGVFGVLGDITRTSDVVSYEVVRGATTEGTKPSDPTPDIYEQILALLSTGGGSGGEPVANGIPAGGKSGQILRKKSDKSFDVEWADFEIPNDYGKITYNQDKTIIVS